MTFQDEGGLLLPPSIEQKISSTGIFARSSSGSEHIKLTCFKAKSTWL
jgi:hypothetical protein